MDYLTWAESVSDLSGNKDCNVNALLWVKECYDFVFHVLGNIAVNGS